MPSWFAENGIEYATAIAWGKVMRRPRFTYKTIPVVTMLLQWKTKKDKIVCKSWGNNDVSRVLVSLSRGDTVLVLGTYCRYHFKNRRGEEKTWYGIKAELVIPMELLGLVLSLYASQEIQDIVFGKQPSDPFESAKEFAEDCADESADDIDDMPEPIF